MLVPVLESDILISISFLTIPGEVLSFLWLVDDCAVASVDQQSYMYFFLACFKISCHELKMISDYI